MILLDTNILSELMKPLPNEAVVAWVDSQPAATLFISAITRAEIELGIALLPEGQRKQTLYAAAQQMFRAFTGRCAAFEETAAGHYGQLVAQRIREGRPITVEDGQIAAIALTQRLKLATRNTRDFAGISNLELLNPWSVQ